MELMHKIIDFSTTTNDVKGKNMTKFSSKQRSRQSQLHLTYDWNMTAPSHQKVSLQDAKHTKFS
jgi:hypothetical protein